ncbi:hypothetical protein [Brevibacillus brevis]|uniref:Uncharacterized protein n=1 Tax=Brevibacillus brevis TaxID=1393 RepID=A0ABY9T9S9_BREBE|nr:hypothetical protein [Brevibacillus brevis]WNC16214.1 hypothetical protein RGB73_07820 [Brevibacillus brevis]
MTYNNIMQSQFQPQMSGAFGQAGAIFQPGFAGTNAQEVQQLNHGGQATQATYGSFGGGFGGAQAVFQPGFAGTNVQEVRQLNSGFASPQQFGSQQSNLNSFQQYQPFGYTSAQSTYQPAFGASASSVFSPGFAGTNVQEVQARNQAGYTGQSGFAGNAGFSAQQGGSIFSPGFAGTNVQEVQARNQAGYTGLSGFAGNAGFSAQQGGSIFSPGFAGTNTQEVRQLNQGSASAGITGAEFGLQQQAQQSFQNFGGGFGGGAQSMFSPGFAGTNTQEVRQLNQGSASAGITGAEFGLQQQQQQAQQSFQNFGGGFGGSAQSMFSPGFAGTNAQEVRSLNHGGAANTGAIFPGIL